MEEVAWFQMVYKVTLRCSLDLPRVPSRFADVELVVQVSSFRPTTYEILMLGSQFLALSGWTWALRNTCGHNHPLGRLPDVSKDPWYDALQPRPFRLQLFPAKGKVGCSPALKATSCRFFWMGWSLTPWGHLLTWFTRVCVMSTRFWSWINNP